MLTFYDSQNQPVNLLKTLGKGGEGTVFTCTDETLVGKIYHEPISDEKAEKLHWMASRNNEQLLKTTAWVAEILKDKPDGKIIGFMMPKIKAKEIHELYSPKSRRIHFPDATWHFLVHTAKNLARAFHNLHRDGHVMGDVNQGNCVVTADGTVKLIDCDSYEISTGEKVYPCEVGVTTHIPPELQGKTLRGVDRSDNHDNFGLAVIIFQLLFLGRHPFAGNYRGTEDKTIEDAIREHLFVYGRDAASKNVVQPPGTPPLSAASAPVAELFERAFSTKNERPKPHEWVQSLEYLGNNLQQCLLNPGHVFYAEIAGCPWCEIEENTGLILFPFTVSSNALTKKYERDFNVATVENLVESFNISALQEKFSEFFKLPEANPSVAVIEERRRLNKTALISLGIAAAYLVVSYFSEFALTVFLILLTTFIFRWLNDESANEFRKSEREKFAELKAERDYLEGIYAKTAQTTGLTKHLFQTNQALREYENLNTAVQKTHQNYTQDSPAKDLFKSKIQRAESKITECLISLRSASVEARRQQQKLFGQKKDSPRKFAQAQANVKHLGYEIPLTQIILWLTIGLSFFLPSYKDSMPKAEISDPKSTVVAATNKKSALVSPPVKIPSESITDKQIAAIPRDDRNKIIKELIKSAYPTLDIEKNEYSQKLLRFALRFDENNAETISTLARALYNSGDHKEAVKLFEKAQAINPAQVDNFYLGMTYLKLKKYEEARDVFHKLNSESISLPALYNLGTAYQGLKEYDLAAQTYGKALKLSPGDADSLYQLGICFSKMNDTEGVKDTYATLKALNSPRAVALRKSVSKSINLDVVPTDTYPVKSQGAGTGSGRGTGSYDLDAPPPPPPIR